MNKLKLSYYIVTGLLTALMLMSVGMYLFNYEQMSATFIKLGYPTYIIYPLALAKIFGLIAIWQKRNKEIKEWAYAGFFFDFVLAFFAHIMISDGEHMGAIIATILLIGSYILNKKQ